MKRFMLSILVTLAAGMLPLQSGAAEQSILDTVAAVEDCAVVLKKAPGVQLSRGTLTIRLIDRTSRPAEKHLQALAKPACLSLYGARQAAAAEGKSTGWMDGLPFLLEDRVQGADDQAEFQRTLVLGEFPRSVQVAAGTVSSYTQDELVWVLGHELGHGLYEHALKKDAAQYGGAMAALAGAGVAIAGRGAVKRAVGAAVAVAGAAAAACGKAKLTMMQELDADAFGVRAVAQSGMGQDKAKRLALAVLNRHPAQEESCLSYEGINTHTHPGTRERIGNITAMR
jgi:hypothetical protein